MENDRSGQREVKTFILKAQLETVAYIRGEQDLPTSQRQLGTTTASPPPPHLIGGVGRGQTLESKIECVSGGQLTPGIKEPGWVPDAQLILPMFPHQIGPTAPLTPAE